MCIGPNPYQRIWTVLRLARRAYPTEGRVSDRRSFAGLKGMPYW